MKGILGVHFLAVTGLFCGLADAWADDSFLNRTLAPAWVDFTSYQDHLEKIEKTVQKRVITPDGLSLLLKNHQGLPEKSGILFGMPGDKNYTVRDYLNRATPELGLMWSYDAEKAAVVLDFPWHVRDPRTGAELMKTLLKTEPPYDRKDNFGQTSDAPQDSWRAAFEGLLSKPENFAKALQVRTMTNKMTVLVQQPINLATGNIEDETGTPHLLILTIQGAPMGPSSSIVSYYLFSQAAKFEQGGLFYAHDRWTRSTVEWDADKKRLILHNVDGLNRDDQIITVGKGGLVHKEDLFNGRPSDAENSDKFLFTVKGN